VQTAGQAAVAQRMRDVEPGTLRHQVLVTAQKFKSSWVELGALLVKVRKEGVWEQWGFKNFEEYCSKELRIKKQTAEKLTHSYGFLSRHEKGFVERYEQDDLPEREPPPAPAPAFEVISVLAGAEERGQLKEQDYQALREQIWADERPANQVVRELSERFPPPPKPPPPADLVLRKLAQTARKMAAELKVHPKVGADLASRAETLAEDLEELAAKD